MFELFLSSLEDQLGLIVNPPLAPVARMGIISQKITRITSSGLTKRAADGDTGLPEYGATSHCEVCAKRIVFCGDNVWLHCEPQDHGFARPNGTIENPRR